MVYLIPTASLSNSVDPDQILKMIKFRLFAFKKTSSQKCNRVYAEDVKSALEYTCMQQMKKQTFPGQKRWQDKV